MSKKAKSVIRQTNRGIPHSSIASVFTMNRRTLLIMLGVSAALLTAVSMVTVHGVIAEDSQKTTHEVHREGNTVTTTTNANSAPNGDDNNSAGPKTNVYVNDQPVEVPKNGSVSKTITNDNGTTQIDVSNTSSADGSSFSSSVSSSTVSSSTNNYSQSVNINSSP